MTTKYIQPIQFALLVKEEVLDLASIRPTENGTYIVTLDAMDDGDVIGVQVEIGPRRAIELGLI